MTLTFDPTRTISRSDFIWMGQVEVLWADRHQFRREKKTRLEAGAPCQFLQPWPPALGRQALIAFVSEGQQGLISGAPQD